MQTCSVCQKPGHNKRWHETPLQKDCCHCKTTHLVSEFRKRIKTMAGGERKKYTSNVCNKCDAMRCSDRYRSSIKERLRHSLGAARHRCKKEGIPFDLDLDYLQELVELQEGLCFYTKELLSEKQGSEGASIDRKEPKKGYTRGNIAITSWLINNMKRDLTVDAFIGICGKIANSKD